MLWALNRGSGPFTLTKTLWLTWCLDANSRLFSLWTLNQGSSPFAAALYFLLFEILLLISYLDKYFHQAFKFPVHFFREPYHLLLCLFLEVVINLSFQSLSSINLFVSSIKNYLSPEMIKKYLNILNFRKKRRCQTKNTSLLLCMNAWLLARHVYDKYDSPRMFHSHIVYSPQQSCKMELVYSGYTMLHNNARDQTLD